ncbi:hypothetical protein [Brevibacillus halotolerans]|uniref:hypothetical protein n=1 Tax=Brevibacillus halotolerans TaxID=1507437 RepID=UPI0015EF8FF0|nr:hypothetical protein [Brevibacillus halotolerans]MBA4535474.1 hypothetical protein [Brevibacillus halotolerans]
MKSFINMRWVVVCFAVFTLFSTVVILPATEVYASLNLEPGTEKLKEEWKSIAEKVWDVAKEFAKYAAVILLLIALLIRAFAGNDNNKIASSKSFALWGLGFLGGVYLVDVIVSAVLGIFSGK